MKVQLKKSSCLICIFSTTPIQMRGSRISLFYLRIAAKKIWSKLNGNPFHSFFPQRCKIHSNCSTIKAPFLVRNCAFFSSCAYFLCRATLQCFMHTYIFSRAFQFKKEILALILFHKVRCLYLVICLTSSLPYSQRNLHQIYQHISANIQNI